MIFDTTKEIGDFGETRAVHYLRLRGYTVKERNWRHGKGELDIIAATPKSIVFVEVKTRSNLKYGLPSEAVNYKKQQKYINIANYYLQQNNLADAPVSFMVAEVLKGKVNLITDAF